MIVLKDNSYFTLLLKQISNKTLDRFRLNSSTKPKLLIGYSKPSGSKLPFQPFALDTSKRDLLLLSQNTEFTVSRTHVGPPAFSHLLTFAWILLSFRKLFSPSLPINFYIMPKKCFLSPL